MRITLFLAVAMLVRAPPISAQHDHTSPYAGDRSAVASLSEDQLAELRSGEGMGLARAAELNHFPGPKHALEMGDALGLTDSQRSDLEAIRARMSGEAVRLGGLVIEAESELSRRFEHAHVDADTVRDLTARIGSLRAELRAVHLLAHVETRAVLVDAQIAEYDRFRGYAPPPRGRW